MSVRELAARTGISTDTIYRRWPEFQRLGLRVIKLPRAGAEAGTEPRGDSGGRLLFDPRSIDKWLAAMEP